MLAAGQSLKQVMGAALIGIGLLIVADLDKRAETWLVEASPQWLTDLTTRF